MFWNQVKIAAMVAGTVAVLGTGCAMPAEMAGEKTEVPRDKAAEKKPAEVAVTPRGADAWKAFEELARQGGPRVRMLGERRSLLVPTALRFKPVEGRKLVEAVAAAYGLKPARLGDGMVVVLQRGAVEGEVERVLAGLMAADPSTRGRAAWLAGCTDDVRVMEPLLAAAADADVEVSRQAARSALRMDIIAVTAIGGEKALALLEKALADPDAEVRSGAALGLGSVGGEKARDILLRRLAEEKDRNVLGMLIFTLCTYYAVDPVMEKVIKEAETRLPK